MISIIYSTHKDENYNKNFKQHLEKSAGIEGVEILEYINNNQYSLSEVYNRGVKESKYNIVVCCHNDIKLEKEWGKKLLLDFENNPEYGIIGKAGSCYFPESGVYWEKMNQTMVGQVYHHPKDTKKWLSRYSPKLPFLVPVVTIDGLFISFDKRKIKNHFDETLGKFHFYDHSFCLPNFLDGVKIGVTSSFEITHESVGQPDQEFFETKINFLKKWGSKLPLDLKPNKIFVPEIKEKPIKKVGKVAVIIPTKGKVDLLINCVNSFFEHCNPNLFNIFIADTGSSSEEKNEIKTKISKRENIKFIEYDYYNFAQINNDVVKKHIDSNFEFLLFCNNDVKILNNVIYGMLKIFKESKKIGTLGARLHFDDKTVQHDGMIGFINKENSFNITHKSLRSYYNHSIYQKTSLGNTGALMMIRKEVFIKCGMFNEKYLSCFEDVELNMRCLLQGLTNITDSELVAYHYESLSRDEDSEKLSKLHLDYTQVLLPFVQENLKKLTPHLLMENKNN